MILVYRASKSISRSKTDNKLVDSVATGVVKFMNGMKNINQHNWSGQMTNLDSNLRRVLGRNLPDNWPASPSALRVVLNKSINKLRNRGVKVAFSRTTDRSRTRLVKISA